MSKRTENWQKLRQRQRDALTASSSWENDYQERKAILLKLKRLIQEQETEILTALKKDLGKSPVEAYASEIAIVLNEIDDVLSHLKKWLRPQSTRRFHFYARSTTVEQRLPYGQVLILAPWNYPLQLTLLPLVGAWSGGNRCFVKPSEYAPAASALLTRLLTEYFPSEWVVTIEGPAEAAQELLTLEWDYVFFTGSPEVGRKVYQAAARHLTPVTLELGGKNPCIVDQSAFSRETVRQILWGKFLNAGQTCVAPDTIYVEDAVYPHFLQAAAQELIRMYGEEPRQSRDYGRIIHQRHFQRLTGYLKEGTIQTGGAYSEEERYIAPTILTDLHPESPLWEEEIFGPILPVIPYSSLPELLETLQLQPAPLVVYCFTKEKRTAREVEKKLRSGAFSWNQVVRQAASPSIPFGGTGESGFGRYHGKESFQTFTYLKPKYRQRTFFATEAHYPPYSKRQLQIVKKGRKWLF